MITEKFTDYYEYLTTEEICYETICELVPETTTTFDTSSSESWSTFDTKFTTDEFDTYETYVTTTDIAMYDTTLMEQNEFDNLTNESGENSTYFTRESLTKFISNMTETEQLNLRRLCWETMFGQELVKLTVMDLVRVRDNLKVNNNLSSVSLQVATVTSTIFVDFFRALFVRFFNKCWCWDLEKRFPKVSIKRNFD